MIKNEIENAVGYVRVSIRMETDGDSLERQRMEIEEYSKNNKLNLMKIYEDSGIYGTATQDRVELNQLLNDIENNKNIKTIVVYKLSRISRNINDVVNLLQLLENHGVNLVCIKDGIDTSNIMGKTFTFITNLLAEMERDNIA